MATNERGHTIPDETSEAPSFDGIFGTFDTINDILLVANTSDRATKAAALSATPSAARPLVVARADAPAGSELEYTTDGSTFKTLRGADPGVASGSYSKAAAALDGTLGPVPFTTDVALAGVTNTGGSFTFSSPGVYSITVVVTSDDGTADTGHEARLYRGGAVVGRARGFAPAGGTGLGRISHTISWVGAIRDSNPVIVQIDSIGTGGRSSVSASMTIERLTY